ncbi:ribonuclease Y [Candidatus Termititenax dinenymphae]|uniref:Ribonuclease Y n=1 Tax=Candidatus Termititenax dinenymphae TaxID=2218523 RepID=A0A388TLC4_9BACT|nr:ribonuclease Y [Candidatus Termititenax dinenymphae]
MLVVSILLAVGGLVLGGVIVLLYTKYLADSELKEADQKVKKKLSEAELIAENIIKSAEIKNKDEMLKLRNEFEKEIKDRRGELNQIEQRLTQKEVRIDEKEINLLNKDKTVTELKTALETKQQKLDALYNESADRLEKIASLSKEEAKKQLLESLEQELKSQSSKMISDYEEEAKRSGEKKARDIVALAIKRCAIDNIVENTTSIVELPSDDMKGRIIGREGRNIRTFEQMTGIDVVVDDTPEVVILSGFDPIRREIARLTLKQLVTDGRIHPARIEETVEKMRKDLSKKVQETGEKVALELDVQNLSPKAYDLIGRLAYRTSYGQNCLQHSIEVAHISGLIAQELGVNHSLAKRAGLLHDIGKAIDFENEGTHAKLGGAVLKKLGESDEVIHAVLAHHEEVQPSTIEAIIVMVSDAISAARPGARREAIESYIKRMEKLEQIANSFNGVEKSFAIQAGREIRVMVKPDVVDDSTALKTARDIARKIEAELEYPGQIKVSVIRETRVQDFAK